VSTSRATLVERERGAEPLHRADVPKAASRPLARRSCRTLDPMSTGTALASTVSLVFVALSLWHVRMAVSPSSGESGAMPSVSGKPLFVPSARATWAVAVVLLLFACLVAAMAGLLEVGIPRRALSWLCYALALGLFARAIGEFKYVGFFKRVRGTRFARLDTLVYSPLCLLLALGVALVAWQHGI
jgi:hypothetical protein